ncbi:MAG: N-6 DNA methylase [Bacteroidota bacterium]
MTNLGGGYYTPKIIAEFLTKWALFGKRGQLVLEPSCGDGVFLETAAIEKISIGDSLDSVSKQLHAIELVPKEWGKAKSRLNKLGVKTNYIYKGDFFNQIYKQFWRNGNGTGEGIFDVVIGNPPFLSSINFPTRQRDKAMKLMISKGFKPNKRMNIWAPFLVIASHLLNKKGRLAMVIPAELFQLSYAEEIRKFISNYFERVTIVTFRKLVFSSIQQEVILLMAERCSDKGNGIRVVDFENANCLNGYDHNEILNLKVKPLDHSQDKWTQYFLDSEEIDLLKKVKRNKRLNFADELISVENGITTGCNKFFMLNKERGEKWGLNGNLVDMVSRSAHLRGLTFNNNDFHINRDSGYNVFMFKPTNNVAPTLDRKSNEYIQSGEHNKYHKGYKCRVRKKWYEVPSYWVPDAFALGMVYRYPKLILNETRAACTDTIYRVRFINGHSGRNISAAFMNSLTFAFSEITGRSYGGGVLTFLASEIEKLPIPVKNSELLDFYLIDELLRENKIDEILNITDPILLIEGLGIRADEVAKLRSIWKKLRDRRLNKRRLFPN